MNFRRALVTGASGFIGTRLVGRLRERGIEVVALDLLPPRTVRDGVSYHEGDVREPLPLALGEGVDVIFNLAAVHRTPGHPTAEYYDTNVHGAVNVVALAEALDIANILFTSSISVYGPTEALLTEQAPLRPVSAYGRSKRMAETIHQAWVERDAGRKLVVVRPGVVFGPGEQGNYTYLAKALRRGYFVYPGRRDAIKSGGFVDELLLAMEFALDHSDRNVLFNYAYPDLSTTEDIVGAFGRVAGFRARSATIPTLPMLAAASLFEIANALGVRNPIHRERILKLVQSTRIAPGWLNAEGYPFSTNLEGALTAWRDETGGSFE